MKPKNEMIIKQSSSKLPKFEILQLQMKPNIFQIKECKISQETIVKNMLELEFYTDIQDSQMYN